MAVVETLNIISETVDKLIDFAVADEFLGKDFELYLVKNKIEISRQSEINAILVEYILDGRLQNNVRVLDYCTKMNQGFDLKIIKALKNSFISVFKINKILKNAYLCTCLANEYDFELIPLVKMTNLRGVGLYDFIKARMIEIEGAYYLLEIFECFGSFREHFADIETVKCLIKYPESQTMYNKDKLEEIKASVKLFNEKFYEIFKSDEKILSNKDADDFIKEFNGVIEGKNTVRAENYEDYKGEYKYFELENTLEDDFLQSAKGGFSNSESAYDIGFYRDENLGLFIVPFLGTINYILKENSLESIENGTLALRNFVISDKVSPNLLIKKSKEYKNFIPLVNMAFNKDFQDIREIISFYKADWIANLKFSPIIVLYNSKTFEKILNLQPEGVGIE